MSLQDLQNRLAQVHASKAKAEAVFTALENPGLLDAVDNNTLDQEQLGWPDVVSPFFSSCASEKSGRQTYKLGNLDRILHLATGNDVKSQVYTISDAKKAPIADLKLFHARELTR